MPVSLSPLNALHTLYGHYTALRSLPWYSQLPIVGALTFVVTVVLPLALFFVWFFFYGYLRPRYFSPFRDVPGPPLSNGHWLWGEGRNVILHEHGQYQAEWNRRYGGRPGDPGLIRQVGPIGIERLIVFSPTALRQIMTDYTYTKPRFATRILAQIVGYGLLTVEGDVHKRMRRDLNPAFATKYLAMQYEECGPLLASMCEELDKLLGDKPEEVVNIYDMVSRTLLDVICLNSFGYQSDSLHNPDEPLAKAYHTILDLQTGANMAGLILIMATPFGLGFRAIEALLRHDQRCLPVLNKLLAWTNNFYPLVVLTGFVESLGAINRIAERLYIEKTAEAKALGVRSAEAGEAAQQGKVDVLSLIIKGAVEEEATSGAKKDKSRSIRKMDALECKAHIMTFLGAGHETTSSGVSWAIWLMANHHEVQSKLRKECQGLLARSPSGHPDYHDLRSLEYLNAVVYESLRVRPSVPGTFRKTTRDSYLDGVFTPKDTYLAISSYAINTNPRVWGPDAVEFKPERWLPEEIDVHSPLSVKPKHAQSKTSEIATNRPRGATAEFDPAYSFMTFIAGNHHCIGKNMALIEMKAILFQLVTKFSWDKREEGQHIRGDTAITMKPRGGVPIRLRRLTEEEKVAV